MFIGRQLLLTMPVYVSICIGTSIQAKLEQNQASGDSHQGHSTSHLLLVFSLNCISTVPSPVLHCCLTSNFIQPHLAQFCILSPQRCSNSLPFNSRHCTTIHSSTILGKGGGGTSSNIRQPGSARNFFRPNRI